MCAAYLEVDWLAIIMHGVFTSFSAPSGGPQNLAPSVSSRSIRVTWDPINCTEHNGRITGYTVEFGPMGESLTCEGVAERQFTRDRLTPGRTYTFRVAGVNPNGNGPFVELTLSTDEESIVKHTLM